MKPQHLNFGGGTAESAVNPLILILVLVAGVLICVLPRKKAIAPFLALGILVPFDQIVVVAGVHFQMLRVLALFGFVRILRDKLSGKDRVFIGGMNGIDWAFIVLNIFTLINGALLWQSQAEIVFQVGNLITALGSYFLLRHLIRDEQGVKRAFLVLLCVTLPVAVLMTYEHLSGRNPYYAMLEGARSATFSSAIDREDVFRARGVFAHPNLAGAFGGFIVPLFVGWWWKEKRQRKWAALGVLSATAIPFLTGSSTALFGFLGGTLGLCLWPLRRKMRILRWAILITLVSLHLAMKAPVWHLVSRIDLTGSSSSYHRYQLINQCILHFWDWALIGTKNYADWGWDMWDLSNQYVATADTAGLIPLLALLAILVYGFKYIGRARRRFAGNKRQEFFVWALGVSLFANVVAYFGISYFDQTVVGWYALLAMISAVAIAPRTDRKNSLPRGFEPALVQSCNHLERTEAALR